MAKRLIDANALKKLAYPNGYSYVIGESRMVVDVTDIDNAPTVSAVEVVRCKNCKYNDPNDTRDMSGYFVCRRTNLYVGDDDYCSYGEVKK